MAKVARKRRVRGVSLTRYGYELVRPFPGAILVADGPGDDQFDLSRLTFARALQPGEMDVTAAELARRAKGELYLGLNWGQRALERVWAERDKILKDQWPFGMCVYFLKTHWANRRGDRCGLCLMRYADGWTRTELWLEFTVGGLDLLPRMSP